MNHLSATPIQLLLVDDESAILRSLKRVLGDYGFEIQTATCAAEANAILKHYQIDVVLCDHQMPGKTGLEFLAELRSSQPELITMMLSGQISGLQVAESWAEEIGVAMVFAKPFNAAQIAEAIQQAYDQKHDAVIDDAMH